MLKFLIGLITAVAGMAENKFIKFLVEVFQDKTGDILDQSYKVINEGVQNAEKIGEYIHLHREEPIEKIGEEIAEKYGYLWERDDIELVLRNKGEGKYNIAFKIIVKRLEMEGKAYTKQAINLGIEFAVNRFFGKK